MTKYLIIILAFFMASCSTEKKITRFLKKVPPKEVATFISLNYPEYLEPRSVILDTIIRDTILVTVPEYSFDTLFIPSDSCKEFHYLDNRLRFDVKDGKVSYKLLRSQIAAPIEIPVYIEKECAPCPTIEIVKEAKKELDKAKSETELIQKNVDYWRIRFFILCGLILAGVAFKFRKLLGVPV